MDDDVDQYLFRFANLEGSLQQHEANYYCGRVTVPVPHKRYIDHTTGA